MWRVCVQPSAFCKLLCAENKRLIRPIQTSLHTSKEVVLTQGRGKIHVSPRQNYPLHRYFQFTVSRLEKLIPFLPVPVEFTVLSCGLCDVQKQCGKDGALSIMYEISLWWISYGIKVSDNCFQRGLFLISCFECYSLFVKQFHKLKECEWTLVAKTWELNFKTGFWS